MHLLSASVTKNDEIRLLTHENPQDPSNDSVCVALVFNQLRSSYLENDTSSSIETRVDLRRINCKQTTRSDLK